MKTGKLLEKLLTFGVLPLVLTAVLTTVLLIFIGVDVGAETAKAGSHLPFVGRFFSKGDDQSEREQKLEMLTAELDEQKQTVQKLEQSLRAEKEKYAQLLDKQKKAQEQDQKNTDEQLSESYRQAAKRLEEMPASKSAPIVAQMPYEEALLMIYSMKPDAQSSLLSKLPSDQAARYTQMLKAFLQFSKHMPLVQAAEEAVNQTEDASGKEKVNGQNSDIVLMFANMQPAQAAKILEHMPDSDTLQILRGLDASTRAQILASLDPKKASDYAEKLADKSTGGE